MEEYIVKTGKNSTSGESKPTPEVIQPNFDTLVYRSKTVRQNVSTLRGWEVGRPVFI